ncbi:MAG: autoinducer 2 ABC transporter substrate-binding protein [Microbacterium sp.]
MKTSRVFQTVVGLAVGGVLLAGCSGGGGNGGGGGGDETVKVAFVPKLQGSPYFEAMNTGAEQAMKDNDNLEWIYQGPTNADATAQADVVRSMIQQQVDVLIVAPNDPDSLGPLLQEAQSAGIKVATSDTDAPDSVRELFVSQATADGIGTTTMDTLAEAMGEEGEYGIVSCGETAENLNSWIEVEKAHQEEAYPDMELVEVGYSGEDQAANAQMATDFMNAYPDLKGLIGQCTTSAVGVAQAVRDADRIGEVFSVGVGTPKSMLPYLEDGSSSGSILWDVEQFGYLTAWAGLQLGLGEDFAESNEVNDQITEATYSADDKTLLLGPPTVFDAENAGDYDY